MRSIHNLFRKYSVPERSLTHISSLSSDAQSQLNTKIAKPLNVITVGSENCDFTSINSAVAASSSGDLVLVYSGVYNEQVALKNGVDIECLGNVTISSSNPQGTIVDNNILCVVMLKGFPTILNSTGENKKIVLQNSNSVIKTGSPVIFEAVVTYTSNEVPSIQILSRQIPAPFDVSYNSDSKSIRIDFPLDIPLESMAMGNQVHTFMTSENAFLCYCLVDVGLRIISGYAYPSIIISFTNSSGLRIEPNNGEGESIVIPIRIFGNYH